MAQTFHRFFYEMYTMWMKICTWLFVSYTLNFSMQPTLVASGLGDFKLYKRNKCLIYIRLSLNVI